MISNLAYVDPSARLGENVKVHPFAYIDANVEIGDNCEIMPYACIVNGTRMGKNCKVYQGATIGADPQDFRWDGQQTYCYIGDNTVIREQAIINRGIHESGGTRIGNNCFIMAEAHIGHDSVIMGPSVLGNGVKIAGDAVVEPYCVLSSNVVLHENAHVGQWSLIKGGCRISKNVPPYAIVAHNPAVFYGVNSFIMRKKGQFTEEDIENAAKAYRHIYHSQTSVFNALRRIEADVDEGKVRDNILNFIRDNDLKIVGISVKTED